jgi:putative endonuclease
MATYFVYMLKSLKDKKFYTGHTADLKRRLKQHNSGMVRSTKARRPFELVYWESLETRRDAMLRERELKSLRRAEKLKLVQASKQSP